MRKKYLSALLFGALLFASAGTFTSCKDYDDDINNLQSQIDANAKGLEELKSLVETGDYVTNIESTEDGIAVTFKNSGTKNITTKDGKGSVVTVEEGVLCIDGEPTEIKVAESTPGETAKAPVKIDGGFWAVLNENGDYDKTNIPVSGVSLAGDKQTGYTLTIVNADGSSSSVELPSAASSLVDLMLPEIKYKDVLTTITGDQISNGTIALAQYEFNLNGVSTKKSDWKGSKELPANGSFIVAQAAPIMIQINPVEVDAKDIEFSLVNSQNKTADVTFDVKDYTGLLTANGTRAANSNGLYDLTISDQIFANSTAAGDYINGLAEKNQALAVAAGKVRSAYKVSYTAAKPAELTTYSLMDGTTTVVKSNIEDNATAEGIELNKWYTVTTDNAEALYDMYLTAADDNAAILYGIEFQNVNGVCQVRATKTPDNITKPSFDINVETIDKEGTWKESTMTFVLSEVISSAYTYAETAWTLVDYGTDDTYKTKNAFSVKMSDMLNSFSTEDLALWNTKIQAVTVQLYDAETGKIAKDKTGAAISGLPVGMHVVFIDKDNKDQFEASSSESGTAAKIKATTTIALRFENKEELAEALFLNHKYKAVITFVGKAPEVTTGDNSVLSTTEIPFTLSIPTIDKLFVEQAGVFVDGVANAYMDASATTWGTVTPVDASYNLTKAFVDLAKKIGTSTFDLALESDTKVDGSHYSTVLAELTGNTKYTELTGSTIGNVKLTLKDDVDGQNNANGTQKGYKQELILNVSNAKFAGVWAYDEEDAVNYSFKVKMMSPILEGKLFTTDLANGIVVPSTAIDGFKVDNSYVQGETYNKREFGISLKQSQLLCMFNSIPLQRFGFIVIKTICRQRRHQIH